MKKIKYYLIVSFQKNAEKIGGELHIIACDSRSQQYFK